MWAAGQEHACPISSQYPCQVDFYQQYVVAGFSKRPFFLNLCMSAYLCADHTFVGAWVKQKRAKDHMELELDMTISHLLVGAGNLPDCLEEPSLQLQSDF